MPVILCGAKPPLQDVSKLGAKASQVYGILWESASMDVRVDPRKHLPWEDRRDFGGTTSWSKKGLADYSKSCPKTISKAIDALLDAGFITVIGLAPSIKGKRHLVFRVIHPDDLEAHRQAIAQFNEKPSVRWKRYLDFNSSSKSTADHWEDEPYEYQDRWVDDDEPTEHIYTYRVLRPIIAPAQ